MAKKSALKQKPESNVIELVEKQKQKRTPPKLRIENLREFNPLTETQQKFFDLFKKNKMLILHGVAGSGKTFISIYKAIEEVLSKNSKYKKVVIIRSCVQSRDMGFLPGDEKDKMDRYALPYKQITATLFENKDAWMLLEDAGVVEFVSTSFLRGTSYNNSIIILDEKQNCNFEELSTIITRVGENSKIIFCGDYRQTDLRKSNDQSGLKKFLEIAALMPSFNKIEFGIDDICRSALVKEWIIAEIEHSEREK